MIFCSNTPNSEESTPKPSPEEIQKVSKILTNALSGTFVGQDNKELTDYELEACRAHIKNIQGKLTESNIAHLEITPLYNTTIINIKLKSGEALQLYQHDYTGREGAIVYEIIVENSSEPTAS